MIASSPGNARFTFTFLRCFVITLRKLPETKDTYFAGIHLDGEVSCPQTSLSAKEETTSVSLHKRPAASAEQNQKQDVDNEAHVEAMQKSQPHVNPLFKVFARHHIHIHSHTLHGAFCFFFGGFSGTIQYQLVWGWCNLQHAFPQIYFFTDSFVIFRQRRRQPHSQKHLCPHEEGPPSRQLPLRWLWRSSASAKRSRLLGQ